MITDLNMRETVTVKHAAVKLFTFLLAGVVMLSLFAISVLSIAGIFQ